ncbi:MAG: threonine--tRNA ligase [Thermoplasmata archaeon]|nr:threonine--tRNA ligase [Thermoplasmata archaeon]
MKLLLIHSDRMEYRVTKAIKGIAEDVETETDSMEDCLVVFCTVEKSDVKFKDEVVSGCLREITSVAATLKTEKVMLYPYAHLSSDLGTPGDAKEIMRALEAALSGSALETKRSPFGWYKSFDLNCKGHPLSELSREIRPWTEKKKAEESKALGSEKKARSSWYVLDLEGELHPVRVEKNKVKGFDFKGDTQLRKFLEYEISKSRTAKGEPPHVKYMRSLEIADYEPGSDPGNMRFYPKGRFIKSLLEQYVTSEVKAYGGMEIESPIMYDFEHPSLKSYLDRFPARQYTIDTPDKRVFLRFAACFGQFLMAHDATFSYKQMPVRLYEMTRYSFRVEQRGELTGLRRLRSFTMPDCHALCVDMDAAKAEMMVRFNLSRKILTQMDFRIPEELQMAVRVTRDFYENNTEFVVNMAREYGKPIVVEMWDDQFFYFVLKYEWNFVDGQGKASALNTDQIDVENGERYGITFTDKDGENRHPLILHLSPSGAIERNIYALLEKAYLESMKGLPPTLPFWLSPTQLRLIPVSDEQLDLCKELADRLGEFRVDIDDTDRTVGRRIRDSEKEWIPFTAVIGDREAESGNLTVRIRNREKAQREMAVEELLEEMGRSQGTMQRSPLPLPRLVSARPKFVG